MIIFGKVPEACGPIEPVDEGSRYGGIRKTVDGTAYGLILKLVRVLQARRALATRRSRGQRENVPRSEVSRLHRELLLSCTRNPMRKSLLQSNSDVLDSSFDDRRTKTAWPQMQGGCFVVDSDAEAGEDKSSYP